MLIRQTAARVARFGWAESRLFEIVGGWVATTPEPEVARLLATHARHHGWRAQLWDQQRPRLHDVDEGELAPDPRVAALLDELAAATATAERLVGVYRVVVPWLADGYRAVLEEATEVSDGPVARIARIALGDLEVDWQAGEAVIGSTITDADVGRATTRQSHLEVALRAGPR